MKQRPEDQPLPTEGMGLLCHDVAMGMAVDYFCSTDIAGRVISDLKARQALGVERYGKPLQAFNGRDAKRDVYEELLDALVYAIQVRTERAIDTIDWTVADILIDAIFTALDMFLLLETVDASS